MNTISIEDYLNLEFVAVLPEDVREEIRRVRTECEQISVEQFRELCKIGLVKRTRKMKKPRTMFVDADKIVYFNFKEQKYNWCGIFLI